ncbi:MAG: hypothetical protein PHO30_00295, partial [Candidatus Omnitrophica bacterium]|nr:hypothetical protein [Candidatus Omnitrophota bacterium]
MVRLMGDVALYKRIMTAVAVVVFVGLGIFFMPQWFYAAVVVFLISVGLYEFYGLIEKKGIFIYKYIGILIGICIPLNMYFRFELTKGWELFFITTAT